MLACDTHVQQMGVYLYLSYELVLDDTNVPIDRSSNLRSLGDPFDSVAGVDSIPVAND